MIFSCSSGLVARFLPAYVLAGWTCLLVAPRDDLSWWQVEQEGGCGLPGVNKLSHLQNTHSSLPALSEGGERDLSHEAESWNFFDGFPLSVAVAAGGPSLHQEHQPFSRPPVPLTP